MRVTGRCVKVHLKLNLNIVKSNDSMYHGNAKVKTSMFCIGVFT